MTMRTAAASPTAKSSEHLIRQRFDADPLVARYPAVYGTRGRHRREREAILRAMAAVAPPASVLDLPCGTGRATRLLTALGYCVTAADASPRMVQMARASWPTDGQGRPDRAQVQYAVCNAMATGFASRHFDAVLCNRLLHHFREPQARQAVLRELGRVCRGPVVVSFFNVLALDALKTWLQRKLGRHERNGRLARRGTWLKAFRDDVKAAGLRVDRTIPVRRFVSQQWYAVCGTDGQSVR